MAAEILNGLFGPQVGANKASLGAVFEGFLFARQSVALVRPLSSALGATHCRSARRAYRDFPENGFSRVGDQCLGSAQRL